MHKIFKLLTVAFCIMFLFTNSYGKNNVDWQEKAFIAAKNGDMEGLKEALKNGADVEVRDSKYKANILDKAITKGHTHIVKWLLINNADPNSPGSNLSALHNAIFRDNFEQTKLLLEYGADIEKLDWHGNTPLINASSTTRIEIFELLLDKGVDVNKQNKKGRTALYYACDNGSDEKVKLLLEKEADPNIATNDGAIPLHAIVKWNMIGVGKVKLLLQYGTKLDAKNNDGLTPSDLLKKREDADKKLLELLNPEK